MVKYYTNINGGGMAGPSPIQELWEERSGTVMSSIDINPIGTNLHGGAKSFLAKYLEGGGSIRASGTNEEGHKHYYSPMVDDGYLIHDNDTEGGVGAGATKRTAWYVGYSIPQTPMGEKIKQRLAGSSRRWRPTGKLRRTIRTRTLNRSGCLRLISVNEGGDSSWRA